MTARSRALRIVMVISRVCEKTAKNQCIRVKSFHPKQCILPTYFEAERLAEREGEWSRRGESETERSRLEDLPEERSRLEE